MNIMSVLTMNEKLMCCTSIYFQMEVKVFVKVWSFRSCVVSIDNNLSEINNYLSCT